MLVKIISGFICSKCGCWKVEAQNEREYYWVDFGVVLKEAITNYNLPKIQEHTHPSC